MGIPRACDENASMPPTETVIDNPPSLVWLHWSLGVLIVGSVALFDPAGWAVFGPVKWMVVTTVTFVAVAVAFCHQRRINRASTLLWLAFLGWGVVASLGAVDPLYTWIGTPDRRLGLLAWVVFFLLFVVAQAIDGEQALRFVLRSVVVALLGIGLYATLELGDFAPVELSSSSGRLGGPFGSPAYLGAACSLMLPLALGAVVDGLGSRIWRALSVGAVVTGSLALIGSQTRAGWIGVSVAALFVFPSVIPWLRRMRWLPAVATALVILVLVASPAGSRIRSVFDPDDTAARGRLDEWRIAAELLVERPILGAGFEGYRIVFPAAVDEAYERTYGRQVTPDRAHSGLLDVGVTTGVPGMLLYLVGLGWLLKTAAATLRSRNPLLIAIAAGVVGYIAQQQLLFPLAEVDPAFWVMAGLLVAGARTRDEQIAIARSTTMVVVASIIAVFGLVGGFQDVRADRLAEQALASSAAGRAEEAIDAADKASGLRPDSIRYPVVAGAVVAGTGTAQGFEMAVDRIESALEISPGDPILLIRRAEYLLELARVAGREADVDAALAAWREVEDRDPNNGEVQLQLGVVLAMSHDAAGAEQAWLVAEYLAPDSAAPAVNLTRLYAAADLPDQARAALERARAVDPDLPGLEDLELLVETVEGQKP
jgi:O-antigen ligase/Flp pilus assembly protein TadD